MKREKIIRYVVGGARQHGFLGLLKLAYSHQSINKTYPIGEIEEFGIAKVEIKFIRWVKKPKERAR